LYLFVINFIKFILYLSNKYTKNRKNEEDFLIDAMALIYKGYYAFVNRPLSNSKGEPTSAIYAFLNPIFKLFLNIIQIYCYRL